MDLRRLGAGLCVFGAIGLGVGACGGGEVMITPRVIPTMTPTEEPLPTRTPRPLPTATRTPAPTTLFVGNTRGDGAVLRAAPGTGQRITGLPEGSRVAAQGEEQDVDGRRWLRVQDAEGRVGWVAADLLVATPPAGRTTPTRSAPKPIGSPSR